MKRDMDLVRKILLAMELVDGGFGYKDDDPLLQGYAQSQLGFHCHLMVDAGLITGSDHTFYGSEAPQAIPTSLTWAGYDFLDAARDETAWNKVKRSVTGMAFDAVKALLVGYIVAEGRKQMGLPPG